MAMTRLVALLIALALVPAPPEHRADAGRLDATGAFFYPPAVVQPDQALATTTAGPVLAETYLRYLASNHETEELADLLFDILLARECDSRGLLRSAPVLARSLATKRLSDSGRIKDDEAVRELRPRFATQALRELRVEALIRDDRPVDDAELLALFERRFGRDGVRHRARQLLISYPATRRLLAAREVPDDDESVRRVARERAAALVKRLEAGDAFFDLLVHSDDRSARRLLRDPARAEEAGLVSGYDQQRYGPPFSDAVSGLAPGEHSPPVETAAGLHIIQLLSREVTRFEDVRDALTRQLTARRPTPAEEAALRDRLFEKYQVRISR